MRILVAGSKGQVGRCLVEQLSHQDYTVLALDKDDLDITDQSLVESIVEEFMPNVIINAAAYTAVDKAEQEPDIAYLINQNGTKYLAKAAEKVQAAFLHISTDYVFNGEKEGLYLESDSVDPQSIYGASKLSGELEAFKYCTKSIVLRTAWVFSEHGNNFVKTMIRLAKTRSELGIVSDQFGGPTYAGDIAHALISIAEKVESNSAINYGVYHFSGEPHVNWSEFAEAIFEHAVNQNMLEISPTVNKLTTDQYPTLAKRPKNSKLSTKKIEQEFGIVSSDWRAAFKKLHIYKI